MRKHTFANILSHFLLKYIQCFISCLSNDLIVTDVLKDRSRWVSYKEWSLALEDPSSTKTHRWFRSTFWLKSDKTVNKKHQHTMYIFPGDSESICFCKLLTTSHFCKQCLLSAIKDSWLQFIKQFNTLGQSFAIQFNISKIYRLMFL